MNNINWTEAWAVVLTGLVVVFFALILLIIVVWAFGKIFDKTPKKAPAPKAAPAPAAPAAPQITVAAPAPAGEDMDELAAVITAALAVVLAEEGSSKSYVVKSIKRVRDGGSVWRNAGLAENVRSF